MRTAPGFIVGSESTLLFSRNASLTLVILPVLGLLSPQSLARDPRNSGAPVGYLQGALPMTFAISSPSFVKWSEDSHKVHLRRLRCLSRAFMDNSASRNAELHIDCG